MSKTVLKSINENYLILNNNTIILSTQNPFNATPVKLVPVTIGNFSYSAIKTEDGSQYICNSNTPGIPDRRQIVYRDTLQLGSSGSDPVNAESLLIVQVSGINVIVSLWNDKNTKILDSNITCLINDRNGINGSIFFYPFFRDSDSANVILDYNIRSWTPTEMSWQTLERSWQTLDNDISVDIKTIYTIPITSYVCSVKRIQNDDDRIHLYPYKIVTLDWLIGINKYEAKGQFICYPGGSWSYDNTPLITFSSNFSGSEPYIPVGDLLVPSPMLNDYSQIPVLLIANKPEYCKLHLTTPYPGSSQISPKASLSPDCFGWAFKERQSVIGSPDSDYVIDISSTVSVGIGQIGNGKWGTMEGKTWFFLSSSYFTFVIGSNSFKDIITDRMKSYCCLNTLPPTFKDIASLVCSTTQPSTNVCSTFMNNFCQGDNLLSESCFNYCQSANCNSNLNSYCQSNTKNKSSPNYTRTCSCFNTTQFYQDWRNNVFSFLPKDKAELIIKNMPPVKPMCDYPDCSTGQSIMPYRSDIGQCPPSSVQICLNNSDISASGKMTDSKIDARSFINCAQQYGILPENTGGGGGGNTGGGGGNTGGGGGNTGGGGGGGNTGGGGASPTSSENTTEKTSFVQKHKIAVIASVVIIIILLITLYVLYK